MMPECDGFTMAKEIRRISATVPIIFLTAKSAIDDIEEGFDIGANDYLKKPFELRELLIRIKSLLRNTVVNPSRQMGYTIGEYIFDPATQRLTIHGKENIISNIEARILVKLAANIGNTVDATELMLDVWQRDEQCNRNSLHGYIHKLRRVLRHDSNISIINQRGFGYMLTLKR